MTEHPFPIDIEQDEDGWFIARVPALPGCHTQGRTDAEARDLILDAIELHLAARRDRGENVPSG